MNRWQVVILVLAMACVAALSTPAMFAPLVSEDYWEFFMSRDYDPSYFLFRSATGEEASGVYYRPFRRLIDHYVTHAIGPHGNILGEHLVSLGLHLACCLALFVFVYRHTRRNFGAAMFAFALLAIHPLNASPVSHLCIRYGLTSALCFLVMAVWLQREFRDAQRAPNLLAMLGISVLLFFMSMISEIGVLGMGALGVWTLWECCRRSRWWHWRKSCVGLLALGWVPVAYLTMRGLALGGLFATYTTGETPHDEKRILLAVTNILIDMEYMLNPFPAMFGGAFWLPVTIVLWLTIYTLFSHSARMRKAVIANPLPWIFAVAFLALQAASIWKIMRYPMSAVGTDRAHVYYIPIAMAGLVLAVVLNELWCATSCRRRRAALIVAVVVVLIPMGVRYRQSIETWAEAGAVMAAHQPQMETVLKDLPENTDVYLWNFPTKIVRPNMPWAYEYDYTHRHIIRHWAGGKEMRVSHDVTDGQLPDNFDGIVFRADGLRITTIPYIPLYGGVARSDGVVAVEQFMRTDTSPRDADMAKMKAFALATPQQPIDSRPREPQFVAGVYYTANNLNIKNPAELGFIELDFATDDHATTSQRVPVRLYWSQPDEPFMNFASVRTELELHPGTTQRLSIPLYLNPAWTTAHTISNLRIDINPPHNLTLKAIRFTN